MGPSQAPGHEDDTFRLHVDIPAASSSPYTLAQAGTAFDIKRGQWVKVKGQSRPMPRTKRPISFRGAERVPPRPPDPGSSATMLKRCKTTFSRSSTSSDATKTCLTALYQSADGFPLLKSVCGSVLALWGTANRIKSSRKGARALVIRCVEILNVIADSVPDPSGLSSEMQASIEKFNDLLDDIIATLEEIQKQKWTVRFVKLNRNEDALSTLDRRVDDIYRDLNTAATLQTHCVVVNSSKLIQTASKQIEILDAKSERGFQAIERNLVMIVSFF